MLLHVGFGIGKAYKRPQHLPRDFDFASITCGVAQAFLHSGWPQPQPSRDGDPLVPCRSQKSEQNRLPAAALQLHAGCAHLPELVPPAEPCLCAIAHLL